MAGKRPTNGNNPVTTYKKVEQIIALSPKTTTWLLLSVESSIDGIYQLLEYISLKLDQLERKNNLDLLLPQAEETRAEVQDQHYFNQTVKKPSKIGYSRSRKIKTPGLSTKISTGVQYN